ncbi:hypothetical protein M91_18106, partial [Bos mutus]
MAGAGGPLRLREWLVAQIESGSYAGLRWEDAGKTLFRIPWKHAAKQGYQVRQDAALFRAWAIYKGKYLEGIDKEDPSTWKTRLRCALNKSADFCEVPERSQLDISNPYKVYRLLSDGAHEPGTILLPGEPAEAPGRSDRASLQDRRAGHSFLLFSLTPPSLSHCLHHLHLHPSSLYHLPSSLSPSLSASVLLHPTHLLLHLWSIAPSHHPISLVHPTVPSAPFHPSLYLHLPQCRLSGNSCGPQVSSPTLTTLPPNAQDGSGLVTEDKDKEQPSRLAQQDFLLPSPLADHTHLERGVLLWVAPEGVFAKRLCQGRVYWRGPLAPHRAQPNKLERERTCQLLDTRRFLAELRAHLQDGCPEPEYQIRLCFGEEYPGPPDQPEERLIMAHVEPVFAREL